MTQKQTGGPAYPIETAELLWKGMTLRDYFAGQALASQTLCEPDVQWIEQYGAKNAYRIADAMIAAGDAE